MYETESAHMDFCYRSRLYTCPALQVSSLKSYRINSTFGHRGLLRETYTLDGDRGIFGCTRINQNLTSAGSDKDGIISICYTYQSEHWKSGRPHGASRRRHKRMGDDVVSGIADALLKIRPRTFWGLTVRRSSLPAS